MGNTVCFTESQRSLEEYAYAWAQVSLAHWWERGHIKCAAWRFPIRIFLVSENEFPPWIVVNF